MSAAHFPVRIWNKSPVHPIIHRIINNSCITLRQLVTSLIIPSTRKTNTNSKITNNTFIMYTANGWQAAYTMCRITTRLHAVHRLQRSPASKIKEVTLISHRSTYIPPPPPPKSLLNTWSLLRRRPGGLDVNIPGREEEKLAPLSTWRKVLFLKQAANIHVICQGQAENGSSKAGDSWRQYNVLCGCTCA